MEGSKSTPAQFSLGLPVCSHVFFAPSLQVVCYQGSSFGADAPREPQAKRYYRGGHSPGKGANWGEILAAIYSECV